MDEHEKSLKLALPDVLRLNPSTGELTCINGQDVRQYLAQWAVKAGVKADTPINIMIREDQQRERNDAHLLRNWAS